VKNKVRNSYGRRSPGKHCYVLPGIELNSLAFLKMHWL